jgi:quercetin dioxygenase-like cupin family protein
MIDDLHTNAPELAELGLLIPSETPPPSLRARLMQSIAITGRFDHLLDEVAQWVQVGAERARELLGWIDEAIRWEPGPGAGISLLHLEGHIGLTNVIAGWVRVEPGEAFPHHEHLGREVVLVLQGWYVDDDGTEVRTGEVAEKAAGTEHGFRVPLDSPPLVYMALVWEGVKIGEHVLRPGDPGA